MPMQGDKDWGQQMNDEVGIMRGDKECTKCEKVKQWSSDAGESEFYLRSGKKVGSAASDFNSECKACMKARSRKNNRFDAIDANNEGEAKAIEYLVKHGIPALPGKAISMAHVDVVAWGCVRIEVKYAKLRFGYFRWVLTPVQARDGILAEVVMVICDYGFSDVTCHFFEPTERLFFNKLGARKTGFQWMPEAGRINQPTEKKPVFTDEVMRRSQDRVELIERARLTWEERWDRVLSEGRQRRRSKRQATEG